MEGVILGRGDARGIDLPDASLDWITCHHAIEHFRQDMDTAAIKDFCAGLEAWGYRHNHTCIPCQPIR